MSHFAKAAQTWCQKSASPVPVVRKRGHEEAAGGGGGGGVRDKKRKKDALYPNDESEKDCKPVSQCPSFKNKTSSSPRLHFHSFTRRVTVTCTQLCTHAHAGLLRLRLLLNTSGKKNRQHREKSAFIISLKTLLAPYLWRTFNSLLPQAALPTLRNAR